jgi:hypothetical protein
MTPSTVFQPINSVSLPQQQGDQIVAQASANFAGGDALIGFSASGYTATAGSLLTFDLWLDGQPTGGQLQMYANVAETHLALGHAWVLCPGLAAGSHEVAVVSGMNTITDRNDTASVTVWEMGDGCAARLAVSEPCPAGTAQVLLKERIETEGGQLLFSESVSGWVGQPGIVSARTSIDGGTSVATQVLANNGGQHLATVPTDFVHTDAKARGAHVVQMTADQTMATDGNDTAHLAVVEWVDPSNAPVACAMNPPLVGAQANSQSGNGGSIAQSQFSTGGGTLLIKVGVSCWTQQTGGFGLWVGIQIDGNSVGYTGIWANQAQMHMACVTNDLVVTGIGPGVHTLNLMAENSVVTDYNDRVSVSIMEFG